MDAKSPDELMAQFGEAVSTETPPDDAPVVVAEAPVTEEPLAPTEETPIAPTAEEQPVEPANSEPAEPVVEPPAPAVDPDEASGRFRLKGKMAAVAQLTKEGMPEEEAIERIYGKTVATPAAEPAPTEPVEDPVAKLETERAEIQARIDAATTEGALLTPELRKDMRREQELLLEIRDAKAEKQQAERAAERQAQVSEDERFEQEWQSETNTLIEMFGDAANDEGALGKAFIEESDKAAKDPKHRFHRHWNSGTFTPLTIGPLLAAELNIPRATKAAPAPATPPVTPRVLPVSGGSRTAPPPVNNAAVAQARTREAIANASSADDMESIFANANGGMTRGTGFRLA